MIVMKSVRTIAAMCEELASASANPELLLAAAAKLRKQEAEIERLRAALTRALCRCTYADCVQHGAFDPDEADYAIEIGNAGTPKVEMNAMVCVGVEGEE